MEITVVDFNGVVLRAEGIGPEIWTLLMMHGQWLWDNRKVIEDHFLDLVVYGQAAVRIDEDGVLHNVPEALYGGYIKGITHTA